MGRVISRPANTFKVKAVAPPDTQKNSDITKAEIEAKLTGVISSHSHSGGGGVGATTVITGTYTILTTDSNIICNSASPFTVTLPTTSVGQEFTISNINAGIITIEGDGSDTIDDELNQTINQWESVGLVCYASNKWKVI